MVDSGPLGDHVSTVTTVKPPGFAHLEHCDPPVARLASLAVS